MANTSLSHSKFTPNASFVTWTNSTIPFVIPQWGFQDSFSLIMNFVAVTCNSIVLFLFIKDHSVRTSFNYYLANLCTANLLFTSVLYAFNQSNLLFPAEHAPIPYCAMVRAMNYLGGGTVNNSHLLIAINRLWAVSWPVAYRRFHRSHTIARPVTICACMWLYVLAMIVPGIVVDALYFHNQPELHHCQAMVKGPESFAYIANLVVFDVPIAIVFCVYPFVLYKTWVRERARNPKRVGVAVAPGNTSFARSSKGHPRTQHTSHEESPTEGKPSAAAVVKAPVVDRHSEEEKKKKTICCRGRRKVNPHNSGNFLTLSLLIFGVLVSLSPAQVFYTLTTFHIDVNKWFPIVWILYSFSPIFDPLLILFTVKSMHAALKNACGKTGK
ncbi:hypothetical protein RvY_08391 [Ramazzottius varieornatus]|uniref:G-protein coupled receptors family 1 profile domain-containing protein n=1 Tax=Ramazzottius varieornatus TaxID=947166 RepID=A0A1D1VEU7_RAMVA|nr:hypothetical protein RvY_08391 [Ramazzottius varieornatus]